MKTYVVDTNVMLRYLRKDIPVQAELAKAYFLQAKNGEIMIEIPYLVFVEAVFILNKLYQIEKARIVEILSRFAQLPFLGVEKRDLLLAVFNFYRVHNVSFIDTTILIEAKTKGREFLTFDKRLKNLASKYS